MADKTASSPTSASSLDAAPGQSRGDLLLLGCFFVSGFCGLVYEIIWMRLLALVMGATVYSLTTVLVAFMAGLGLGAWLIGGVLRRRPGLSRLKLYGAFEIVIGLWCLALPLMFRAVEPLFALIYNDLYGNDNTALFKYSLAQFAVCAPLMLIPTTLMGATLPLLADHFARRTGRVGRSVGLVYGINTFGAVFGAVGAGYVLIPLLGFTGTNLLAVTGNVIVGVAAFALVRGARRDASIRSELPSDVILSGDGEISGVEPPIPRGALAGVFAVFAFAGLASMAYQVAWTRVIALIIDSTTYSFTIIVTSYILGLAMGAWLLSRMIDREGRPVLLLGLVQSGVGLTALVTLPILGLLPAWIFFLMIRHHQSWILMQLIVFALIGSLLLLPTLLMGATFPLVARICARGRRDVGTVVGRAYAINALGTIAGSFVAGFLLIPNPAVGTEKTLILATMLNVALGMAAALLSPELRPVRRIVTALALAGVWVGGFLLCVPKNESGERGWDIDIITSSPFFFYEKFFQGGRVTDYTFREYLGTSGRRVAYREGPFSTVVIREAKRGISGTNDTHMIFTGGRPEASDTDLQQNLLMHLGMILHPNPTKVCCIGLGSGSTARAATYHPSLEHLDVVEISRAVSELSAEYFPEVHADLEAAGANIIVADGRNHLALTDQKYDVIVSQPSHPHLAGVASLFTRDFFQICKDRLAPGGVCVIWNFSWRIEPEMFRAYVRSFQDVFPASLFMFSQGSYTFLVGFKDDVIDLDWEVVRARLEACTDPVIDDDINPSDDTQKLIWFRPEHLIDLITLWPRGVARFAGEGPLNTDDNAMLEYALPRSYHLDESLRLRRIGRSVRNGLTPSWDEAYDPAIHEWPWEYIHNVPPDRLPAALREKAGGESPGGA